MCCKDPLYKAACDFKDLTAGRWHIQSKSCFKNEELKTVLNKTDNATKGEVSVYTCVKKNDKSPFYDGSRWSGWPHYKYQCPKHDDMHIPRDPPPCAGYGKACTNLPNLVLADGRELLGDCANTTEIDDDMTCQVYLPSRIPIDDLPIEDPHPTSRWCF